MGTVPGAGIQRQRLVRRRSQGKEHLRGAANEAALRWESRKVSKRRCLLSRVLTAKETKDKELHFLRTQISHQ